MFVYGSLKRGLVHHDQMRGARFERPARTAPGYRLVLYAAGYPALTPSVAAVSGLGVSGEVYWVTAPHLARLDRFEEVPSLYQRAVVVLDDGTSAQAYLIDSSRARGLPELTAWTGLGDR